MIVACLAKWPAMVSRSGQKAQFCHCLGVFLGGGGFHREANPRPACQVPLSHRRRRRSQGPIRPGGYLERIGRLWLWHEDSAGMGRCRTQPGKVCFNCSAPRNRCVRCKTRRTPSAGNKQDEHIFPLRWASGRQRPRGVKGQDLLEPWCHALWLAKSPHSARGKN